MEGPTPVRIREQLIYNWTELYKPNEWVIESNAFPIVLNVQDTEEIKRFLATRGITLTPPPYWF